MSVSEAARYLGMNRVSIYGVMRRGALRYLQIGGSRAIPLSELRAYQDQRQRLLDKKSPRF
jgi:excisionase family DNA binding protein